MCGHSDHFNLKISSIFGNFSDCTMSQLRLAQNDGYYNSNKSVVQVLQDSCSISDTVRFYSHV